MSARPSGRPNKRLDPSSEKEEDAASAEASSAGDDDIEILEVIGVNETEPVGGEMAPLADLQPIDPQGHPHDHGGHAGHAPHGHASDDDLRQRLDEAEKEKTRLHDLWLRAQAEAENARKRMEREATERRAAETADRLRRLLPVLDGLERAIASPGWGDGGLREGISLTLQQMLEVLGRDGLKVVAALGEAFDPRVHEAVETVPRSDVAEGTVIEEMQRGYLLLDRLIRPALVKVAAAVMAEPERRRAAGG
jgi:molecular chaperone GrpE